jgi:hypothetical protein
MQRLNKFGLHVSRIGWLRKMPPVPRLVAGMAEPSDGERLIVVVVMRDQAVVRGRTPRESSTTLLALLGSFNFAAPQGSPYQALA